MNDLIDLSSLDPGTVEQLLDTATRVKQTPENYTDALDGTTMLHLFGQPSTRTRVSAAAGVTELGGDSIELDRQSSQLSRGESLHDTGSVLARYTDGILARLERHDTLLDLASASDVPVINALTDRFHPLQALSDMQTLREYDRQPGDTELVFVGDGNNVAQSLIQAIGKVEGTIRVSCPQGYEPDREIVERARADGGDVSVIHDPHEAVRGADAIYTDVWVSMGHDDRQERLDRFRNYQVDADLVAAADDPVVMHPLPAHRGEEVTADVLDGDNAIIYDQAENRLHMQKAVLLHLFDALP
ncbi:MAG: ornithine carbamoyltransferase [Candidatus Nanohaloarchaea archaeon]